MRLSTAAVVLLGVSALLAMLAPASAATGFKMTYPNGCTSKAVWIAQYFKIGFPYCQPGTTTMYGCRGENFIVYTGCGKCNSTSACTASSSYGNLTSCSNGVSYGCIATEPKVSAGMAMLYVYNNTASCTGRNTNNSWVDNMTFQAPTGVCGTVALSSGYGAKISCNGVSGVGELAVSTTPALCTAGTGTVYPLSTCGTIGKYDNVNLYAKSVFGTTCTKATSACNPNPCAQGTCTVTTAGYTCACNPGWSGTDCKTAAGGASSLSLALGVVAVSAVAFLF